ncbi:MAG TPA: hypothetical protein VFS76_20155 [Pyrinomonadaceae bacterium]|nr:hypothetical protein [Pyrinomonadaceae bacterium]
MNHPLDGVREKIVKAEAHLATVRAEIASHKNKCTILAKKRPKGDSSFDLYINFPDPPLSLSCAISDCIQNLRTALDYLVYELALPAGEPPIHNLFPICNTPQVYERQVEQRDRLHNVPDKARAIIESLQPYNARGGKRFSHPLYILNKLINADKYRLPALTVICRPQPTFIRNESNGPNRIEGKSITEPFQNGARLTDQRLTEIQADEVTMRIERGIYLPFKDLPWTDSAADTVLGKVVWFVKDQVVPRFESFFEQRSAASVLVVYK